MNHAKQTQRDILSWSSASWSRACQGEEQPMLGTIQSIQASNAHKNYTKCLC
jgi:hypothetical protein